MGEFGKKLVGGIFLVAAVVGTRTYEKSQDKAEVKARLVEICAGETACVQDVETYYAGCFEAAYSTGGRRSGASLDGEELARCINGKSGAEWFAYDPDA